MSSTKQKILETAVRLYNQKGVSNVTLRDIAGELEISTGNLAYHYKNQDYIITDAFEQMVAERDAILAGVQQIPSFENINRQLLPILELARRYQFIYLDTVHLLRSYPRLAKRHRRYIHDSIRYIKVVIDYSVGSGNMRPEAEPGQYERLARAAWMVINYWLQHLTITGQPSLQVDEVRRHIWDLVYPHFTEQGRQNFARIRQPAASSPPQRE